MKLETYFDSTRSQWVLTLEDDIIGFVYERLAAEMLVTRFNAVNRRYKEEIQRLKAHLEECEIIVQTLDEIDL